MTALCPGKDGCKTDFAAITPLALEVIPPANSRGWVRQEFFDVREQPDGTVHLQLATSVLMEGHVVGSDRPSVALPAHVIASRESLFPGRNRVQFSAETVAGQNTARRAAGEPTDLYRLWLNGGHDYTLQVEPKPPIDATRVCSSTDPPECSTGYPSSFLSGVRIGTDPMRKDLVLEGPDLSFALRGRIVDAAGQPLSFGVRVVAVSQAGPRSTIGHTCAADQPDACKCDPPTSCLGTFQVRVPQVRQPYVLRIDPATDSPSTKPDAGSQPAPLVPRVECEGLVLGKVAGAGAEETADTELADEIRLPAFTLTQQYEVTVLDDQDLPVPAAQVTFTTRQLKMGSLPEGLTSCNATYKRSSITDATGKATFLLIPGDAENRIYQVTIISPSKSAYASQRIESYEVGPRGGALAAFRLTPRYAVRGELVDHLGHPNSGAIIEAKGIPPVSTGGAAGRLTPADAATVSTETGDFLLFVDPGSYDIHVRPREQSGAPGFSLAGRRFDGDVAKLVLTAPRPVSLVGRVVDPDGSAGDGFTVQVYDTVQGPNGGTDTTAVVRATAISDADGLFRLVLPARR